MTSEPIVSSEPIVASGMTRRELLRLLGGAAVATLGSGCVGADTARSAVGLHYSDLTDVARLLESGEISSIALTRAMLDRIEQADPRLKSYATVMADEALAAAAEADREIASGRYRGPLHGVPIAVKDLCYTAGVRTMGGTAVLSDFVPTFDATVVARLKSAGAVLLGKLNLTEGAMVGYNRARDVPINPWRDDLWPGVSSSGSGVATAAGLCFASLGTDTGGSIRFPSMANGIVGIKPTYGRVSRYGVLGLSESLDHVGPMARSTRDAAAVLAVIAGRDPADDTSSDRPVPDYSAALGRGVSGLRIGWDAAFASEGMPPELIGAIEAALGVLDGLGAEIVDFEMPLDPELTTAWRAMCAYEAARIHAETYPSRADEYGVYFREFLEGGAAVTDEVYADAQLFKAAYAERFVASLGTVDAFACPAGGVPFAITPELQYDTSPAEFLAMGVLNAEFTFPADMAGVPTLTMPCGFAAEGWPLSIQFTASPFDESTLCAIGQAYEDATDWHTRHPAV